MLYAPVIIPTLNRKTYLERCLLSLSKNKLAKFTDVYISVDYPPNEKYNEGYNEVKHFLNNADYIKKSFHKFEIIFQEKNLGPFENSEFLKNALKGKYDRYIFSEDDNEFSPNFLEYMDKCLEFIENKENVYGICGFKDCDYICDNDSNIIASKLFSGYGIGYILNRKELFSNSMQSFLLNETNFTKEKLIQLRKRNRVLFNIYITDILFGNQKPYWSQNKLQCIDTVASIYMHLTNCVCITPTILKSRTWGNDGSGVNMKNRNIDVRLQWPLDECDSFNLSAERLTNCSIIDFDENNFLLGEKALQNCDSIKKNIKAMLYYGIFKICGFNRPRARRIIEKLSRN